MRPVFLVYSEINLDNELDNICRIDYNNDFNVQYINKLVVDITSSEA